MPKIITEFDSPTDIQIEEEVFRSKVDYKLIHETLKKFMLKKIRQERKKI